MWGKPESTKRNSGSMQLSSGETTYIAADAEFNGTLTLKGNARIDGNIEGKIVVTGDLIVGPSAVIKANIKANSVSVSGEIQGDVIVQDTLELCSTARLRGNIFSKQLKIDQGARFIGTSRLLEDAKDPEFEAKEISATLNAEIDSPLAVEEVLKPLEPIDEEQDEAGTDSPGNKQVAYGKGKHRRR